MVVIRILCILLFTQCFAEPFSHVWELGGDTTLQFQSDVSFEYGEKERTELSAHLPGLQESHVDEGSLKIVHRYNEGVHLNQHAGNVVLAAPWKGSLPPDFIHLAYGAARVEWLEKGIVPVHAACIGSEKGYALIMGNPGSGKTSLTLYNLLHHGQKLFSGDKTLLKFSGAKLVAIAGTHTITIRAEDAERWKDLPKMDEVAFVDRLAFKLPTEYYSQQKEVVINAIVLIGLNDAVETIYKLTPASALHTLYPLFLDKQREDILVEGDQAFFDGSIPADERVKIAKDIKIALERVPVYKAVGSLEKVGGFIASQTAQKKVLFGICGIGNGHCSRQLPILSRLLKDGHQIMVFTYGEGIPFFANRFPKYHNLTIVPVADPYYVGAVHGLDFARTAQSEKNNQDFIKINAQAMHRATQEFGTPDLVVSDYEMVAAQYAYAKQAPLVTVDQQSKYLVGDFIPVLNNTSCKDEVERLSLFFPKAKKRIAVSFFRVDRKPSDFDVEVYPPMIRPDVIQAKGSHKSEKPSILVYVTAQSEQPTEHWISTIQKALPNDFSAHFFLPLKVELPENRGRFHFYHHGDKRFDSILFASHGIISTAGHNLLTEAMYLEKPVYAIPLPVYEQQINAYVVAQGGFGVSATAITEESIRDFISKLDFYAKNIHEDQKYLFKEPANEVVIEKIIELLQ